MKAIIKLKNDTADATFEALKKLGLEPDRNRAPTVDQLRDICTLYGQVPIERWHDSAKLEGVLDLSPDLSDLKTRK